jgi:hypothetical protein
MRLFSTTMRNGFRIERIRLAGIDWIASVARSFASGTAFSARVVASVALVLSR